MQRFLSMPDPELVRAAMPGLGQRIALALEHRFDLLGTGWIDAGYGRSAPGLEGHHYEAESSFAPDREGRWLDGRVPESKLDECRALWHRVGSGYEPIDWHRDLKSGHRWTATIRATDIDFGNLAGVDVKVPWELGRMQHLSQLSFAWQLEPRARTLAEFRHQVLDFLAANPVGYGVQWVCSMDIAIRIVNWLVAYDLFRASGARFDTDFATILEQSVREHGRHIYANLDRLPTGQNHNHYLTHVVGLLFVAAYLGPSVETDEWLAFALAEITVEARAQFLDDGANFEGSTSYHLLSTELLTWAAALILGMRTRQPELEAPLGATLAGAAAFLADVTAPDGELLQIGDTDSGRLLKLAPSWSRKGDLWREDHLDPKPLLGGLTALMGPSVPETSENAHSQLLASILSGLARDRRLPEAAPTPKARAPRTRPFESDPDTPSSKLRLSVPGASLTDGLETRAYPAFGLFLWRSERLWLALRCGWQGFAPRGHVHIDQLALAAWIDGRPWIRDPGAYLYTPLPKTRNAYRSADAHLVPYRFEDEEPFFSNGLFRLDLDITLEGWDLDSSGGSFLLLLAGHRLQARLRIDSDQIELETHLLDSPASGPQLELVSGDWTWPDRPDGLPPFSPGYGLVEP